MTLAERVADLCKRMENVLPERWQDWIFNAMVYAVAEEREACARIADDCGDELIKDGQIEEGHAARYAAKEIRARNQT